MIHRLPCCRVLIAAALVTAGLPSLKAEEPVFLRGYQVAPRHIVFDHAVGLTAAPSHAQAGDYVLVHASRLNLWGAATRMERLAKDRLAQRLSSRGYSTINASPEVIDEVARDDEFQRRQYIPGEVDKFRGESVRKVGSLKSRLGAVSPLPRVDASRESDKPVEGDATLDGLSSFVSIAQTTDLLRKRLTLTRLQRLAPVDRSFELNEESAGLMRHVLVSWTDKALRPAL